MTLILSCITRDHVIQVSDRRLTRLRDGTLIDDDRNKAVLFCGRIAFAYTGLAEMPGSARTDQWLVQSLLNERCDTIDRALNVLAARATDAFADLPWSSVQKRHAFVGVGWAITRPDGNLQPIYCRVTNAQMQDGTWLPEAAEEFQVFHEFGTGRKSFALFAAGATLSLDETRALHSTLGRAIGRRAGAETFADHLVQAVREVAVREATVGGNLMAVVLPRSAVQKQSGMVISGSPQPDIATFEYLAPGRSDGVEFGPHTVCGASGALDFQFTPSDPPRAGDGAVSIRIALPHDFEPELEREIRRIWSQIPAATGKERYPRVIELCQRVLRKLDGRTFKNPGFFVMALVKTQFQLADAHIGLGNPSAAMPVYEKALATLASCSGPEALRYTLLILNNIAVHYLNQGEWDHVIAYCDQALGHVLKQKPASVEHFTGSDLLTSVGPADGPECVRQFAKAFRNKFIGLFVTGRTEEARKAHAAFEDALADSPDPSVQERLSFVREQLSLYNDGSASHPDTGTPHVGSEPECDRHVQSDN